jgi:spore maturation protein CgeB
MSGKRLSFVILGLSLTSAWGNGHATTFRALIRGRSALGHDVLFLERDVPWYADHRDLPNPDFCRLELYSDLDDLKVRFSDAIAAADVVIVGSYVPQGVAVAEMVFTTARGVTAFYDIDTPVTLAKLARGDEEYVSRTVIPGFGLYLSFTGGPTLRRLEQEFGARRAEALFCAVDEGRYAPTGAVPEWDLSYLGTYSDDRQPALERLLIEPARRMPERRFVVAGPQYPASIQWPDNVERIEHLAPEHHADFYGKSRFTLNITRQDMIAAGWSPSVRIFEAGACGTPIISDHWEGLTDLLPSPEAILIAHSSEDVVAMLEGTDDAARDAIAAEARRIILDGHTGRARAQQLVDYVRPA